ncbi:hypothetical protein IFM89_001787 [Coptis chinensis]|uniref:Uncharacterized protein n=1 Tax=Coptis chinensis TaxID=261450 RepID=A0A835HIW9_9MAGN|nr:hypothetical protein IFM89_001787 [Coptis chinensis]
MESVSTFPTTKRFHSHGSKSFSFSSHSSCSSSSFRSTSFSSNSCELPPFSPSPSLYSSKVPFSWEQQPGIPKTSNHRPSKSIDVLPLPPSAVSTPSKRFSLETIFSSGKRNACRSLERDPFAAALVECSKDVDHQKEIEKYWKISKVVGDPFGFMDRYTSCKKSCAVVESVMLLPRSTPKAYNA